MGVKFRFEVGFSCVCNHANLKLYLEPGIHLQSFKGKGPATGLKNYWRLENLIDILPYFAYIDRAVDLNLM